MGPKIIKALPILILAFLLVPACFCANVAIPSLELITRGTMESGVFGLATRGEMDLRVEGGYKFGGLISFTYVNNTIEEDPFGVGLTFKTATITMRQLFALPIDFSFFVGQSDVLCSGDGFTETFGTASFATRYRGYLYFADGVLYDGIHQVKGTGLKLNLAPLKDTLSLSVFAYQDAHFTTDVTETDGSVSTYLDPGHYSIDARVLANLPAMQVEGFAGTTLSMDSLYGYWRGGLLFHASNQNVEFLAQIGIPQFDPATDSTFNIDLFYLLFEPRLHLGLLSIIPTFFWHPGEYLQVSTGESGSFDINLNFMLGDEVKTPLMGGLEGNFRFVKSEGNFLIKASPYLSFMTPGVIWNFKLDCKLWPFDAADLVETYIGLKAEF